jgi:phosphoribosylaminoimidazole carboxylase
VATVGINNSTNAALLAVRMLGSTSPIMQAQVSTYAEQLETEVMAKVKRLEEIGWEDYVLKK